MTKTELTTIQIDKETSELIARLAEADRRSKTQEVAWIFEQELARRTALNIASVQELPHPEGAQVVPVVVMKADCQ